MGGAKDIGKQAMDAREIARRLLPGAEEDARVLLRFLIAVFISQIQAVEESSVLTISKTEWEAVDGCEDY
jgi:hypothetical protein